MWKRKAAGARKRWRLCCPKSRALPARLSVVANQSGFVTSKIIVLMTADEMDQAIKKAMTVEFLPPGE
jgi:hypothetical protein